MSIKVLFFDHSTQFGGAERSLLDMMLGLPFNSVLVSPSPVVISKFKTHGIRCILFPIPAQLLSRSRDTARCVPTFTDFYSLPIRRACILIFKFIALLSREKPDVVYTNTQKAHFIGMISAKFMHIPHICHFRDIFPRNAFSKFWLKCIFLFSTRIIAISKAVMSQFPNAMKVKLIYNGINVEATGSPVHELNSCLHPQKEIPVIGYIGQIARWKGVDYFVRAAKIIAGKTTAKFTIVGSPIFGDVKYMEELKTITRESGLDGKIEFQGAVDNPLKAISNFDIVVHPVVLPEPFGRVLIEAGALGKPVVATREGAIPEIIIDKETGILVPSRNPEAIADAVCNLLSKPELMESMGRKARERVANYFNIDNTIKEIKKVIHNLCNV